MDSQLLPNWKDIGVVMTNFDHSIDRDVEARLKDQATFAQYSGWNFCGFVWYDPQHNKYRCEVWVYGTPNKIVEAETLDKMMKLISDEFGYE